MKKTTFPITAKASVSLCSLLNRKAQTMRPLRLARLAGFRGDDPERIHETDLVSVLLEVNDPATVCNDYDALQPKEKLEPLTGSFVSARVSTATLQQLLEDARVKRLQSKKRSALHLTEAARDVQLSGTNGTRAVTETGQGVLIGVVDSGFDLSHPAFSDGNGLRVAALLDQSGASPREFTTAQLAQRWASGTGPGADEDGHGTHVASIAGGTRHQGFEGVAPGARFLLVKTDFVNTDRAVQWIFDKAAALGLPCVINMSLGHHFGSHDGTDAEERFHRSITGAGKLIVISAGNERNDNIHIGGRFTQNQTQEVTFNILRQDNEPPSVAITLWHTRQDKFDVSLITPSGQALPVPVLGQSDVFSTAMVDVELARRRYTFSQSTQHQITIQFKRLQVPTQNLRNWKLRITCKRAVVGRLDGWFNNSGFAEFLPHPLVESHRTIGLSATGDGCLAVASHVARTSWDSDAGPQTDAQVVKGRTSSFSSLGPTRDGRQKPDFSAPGQYVTAALANGSDSAGFEERAHTLNRLLTIEGTSMATPVVTGIVALLLQKKPTLTLAQAREVLKASARRDLHTGPAAWDPAYGFGKVDIAAALNRV